MENQIQLNAERMELLGKFREAVPQFMAAEAEVIEIAYKEGALSSKVKRLIAMAAALKVGCTNCILARKLKLISEKSINIKKKGRHLLPSLLPKAESISL